MKFLSRYSQFSETLLLLRFGNASPLYKANALFSMTVVAKHLGIDCREAYAIESKYFRDLQSPPQHSQVLSRELTEEITSQDYLNASCTDSLEVRARKLNDKFPQTRVSRHQISKIYKQRGIKLKKIVKVAANPKKYTKEYKENFVKEMIQQLLKMDSEGYEIFQIDESLFSGQDCRRKAWSLPNQNVEYVHLSKHFGQIGVIAAISSKQEIIYSKYKQGYFNSDDTIKFVKYLKRQNAGRKMALFFDNCSTHTSKKVKEYLESQRIPFAYNLPYAPRMNGIERLWAQMKWRFRDKLAMLKVKQTAFELDAVIEEVENSISGQTVIACARSGWQHILSNIRENKTIEFQSAQIKCD